MSKWEKAKFNLANMSCDGCLYGYCPSDCDLRGCSFGEAVGIAVAALDIAERVEKAETDVYNKYCEVCTGLIPCKERNEMCEEASAWIEGYKQALIDVRGDSSGICKYMEEEE